MNSNVIKYGKIINIALIVLTLILFISYQVLSRLIASGDTSAYGTSVMISTVIMVLALVLLVFSIVLKTKNPNVSGLGLMIASAASLTVFSALGLMIGLVVFILSGLSIRKLSESVSENTFEEQL